MLPIERAREAVAFCSIECGGPPKARFTKLRNPAASVNFQLVVVAARLAGNYRRPEMSLFVDKYRPKTLDDLHYHAELSKRIRTLVSWDFGWLEI